MEDFVAALVATFVELATFRQSVFRSWFAPGTVRVFRPWSTKAHNQAIFSVFSVFSCSTLAE
jgi:hypothetical protein